ncbi:MAG: hypothetical protein JWO08_1848, partial [Verrucomicrobiaceae bacterium]|nr:hypothetical protein [Verrucomicrobiaceae bacterium]
MNKSCSCWSRAKYYFRSYGSDGCEIVAFKEDLFGVDSICIGFRVVDRDEYCRVMEESRGYEELITEIHR